MSKTDGVLLNSIGWKMDDDPQPALYFGPTEKNVKAISKNRLDRMIQGVPSLVEGLAKGKADTVYEKQINGVRLGLGWAGSPTELASHNAAVVFLDEFDRMGAVKGEGDVYGLARARIVTYPNGKIVVVSTPLEGNISTVVNEVSGLTHWDVAEADDVSSPTWSLWQQGTRCEWAWPCLDCGEYFIPRSELLTWEEGATPRRAMETARLICPRCGSLGEERHKGEMNARARFVSPGQRVVSGGEIVGDRQWNPIASYWVSGLCSPWMTYGNLAFNEVKASRSEDSTQRQTSRNTGFGECFAIVGESPPWDKVRECCGDYVAGEVHDDVKVLYTGVDVQHDRFVYVVRGFGADYVSWLVEYGEINGSTDHAAVWSRLNDLLNSRWGGFRTARAGIDSGDPSGGRKDLVYQFCYTHQPRTIPTKGAGKMDAPWKATKQDAKIQGRKVKNAIELVRFDTDTAKRWIHSRVRFPGEEPSWRVPSDVSDDYCKQIVAESRITHLNGRVEWKTHGPNHYLDCEVLAYLMARIFGVPKSPVTMLGADAPRVRRQISRGVSM